MHSIIVWYCIRVVKNITENNKTSSKTRLIWQENNQQILQLVEIYVWCVHVLWLQRRRNENHSILDESEYPMNIDVYQSLKNWKEKCLTMNEYKEKTKNLR